MKTIIVFCLFIIMSGLVSAQEKKGANSWSFQSINNIGFLEGQTGSAFQLQTVNGVQYKSWFAGVGAGLDYYRYRTIPLFIDIRKEFFSGPNQLFIYTDAGVSFTWVTDNQKMGYVDDHFSNGFYSDLGLGYKRKVGKNDAILFSLGYSYKRLDESYTELYYNYNSYNMLPGTETMYNNNQMQKINYSLNRLSVKIGWEF